jgi:hypothetical protein
VAVIPDRNLFSNGEFAAVTYAAVIADAELGVLGIPHCETETGLSVEDYIVSEEDVAIADHPVDKYARSDMLPITGAVRLEQWLTNHHSNQKIVD